MNETNKILKWEEFFVDLKVKLFYFLAFVIILGNIIDLYTFGNNNIIRTVYTNAGNVIVICFTMLFYYFKIIKTKSANGILVYTLIFNILISLYFGMDSPDFEKFLLREMFILAAIIPFIGFLLGKKHINYFGIIVLIFYAFIMYETKNKFLSDNSLLLFLVLISYLGWVYYILSLMEKGYKKQVELINIMEIKNLRLDYQKEELHTLNETKDKILSIIAHDLKNPFTSIIISSDILNLEYKKFSNENIYDLVKSINASAHQANKLLDNLLQWSRSHTNKIKLNPKEFNINKIIAQNISLFANSALEKNLQVVSDTENEIEVFADVRMIDTVIRNLLSNAIKFTDKNGIIIINVKKENGVLKCSVSDTGVGIGQENINKLFKIDSHFTAKGTNNESGTGLGLILCKDFIEHHDGKIWVESELGKGSIFYFTIPEKNIS